MLGSGVSILGSAFISSDDEGLGGAGTWPWIRTVFALEYLAAAVEDGSVQEVREGNGDGRRAGAGVAGGNDLQTARLVPGDRRGAAHFLLAPYAESKDEEWMC